MSLASQVSALATRVGTECKSIRTLVGTKANSASPVFTGTPTGITKAHVGLGSVDNTSDAAKPVSTAQQSALNLKANLASPAFTGTPTGITKAHVGLGSVDNTSDANKPVSSAQQAAINDKPLFRARRNAQMLLGDATFTAMTWDVEVIDTDNAFTPGARFWTCKKSGYYRVYAQISLQGASGALASRGVIRMDRAFNGVATGELGIGVSTLIGTMPEPTFAASGYAYFPVNEGVQIAVYIDGGARWTANYGYALTTFETEYIRP